MRMVLFYIVILFFTICNVHSQSLPDSVKQKLTSLDDYKKVEFLGDLCWDNRERNSKLALVYGTLALELADSLNYLNKSAEISNFIGVVLMHYKYNTKASIPYFHKALETGMTTKDSVQIGYAYNNLGDAFYLTGNAPLALEYAENSLAYFEALKNPRGIAYSFTNLGLAYRFKKDFNKALYFFTESMKISQSLNNRNGIAYAILELARTHYEQENYTIAMKYFKESLQLHEEINNKIYMAHCLVGIGDILFHQNRFKEALDYYKRSLELNIERSHKYGILNSRLGMALVYSMTNRKREGEIELDAALKLAMELKLSSKLLDAYETIAKFYLNLSDYKSATENFNTFLAMYDSLYSHQQFETLSEVQNKFEINQRLNEINQELEIQKKEELYLLIILMLTIIISAVIFWRYRSNKSLSEKLKASNESKDRLFSIISHDLKNPFFTLMGNIELLKDEDMTPEERRERIDALDSTTKNTYSLLENLLNLSASRTGKIDFKPAKFELSDLVNSITKMMDPHFKKKSLSIQREIIKDKIYADAYMMGIVLRNLLTNAVKYSNIGGVIKIKSEITGNSVIISVTDEGVGMSKETLDKLFTSELVESRLGTTGERGTGIGLDLCKEFIEKHNGTITIKSQVGQGTDFIITLPDTNLH